MKISRLTRVTMTVMQAERGSSTQPSGNAVAPNSNQLKLNVSRHTASEVRGCRVNARAATASRKETAMEPMASDAASRRRRCRQMAMTAAAASGSTGINQRYWAIQGMFVSLTFQGIDLVQIRRSIVTVQRNCLLYTSDAADDLLCVDLGGRRI